MNTQTSSRYKSYSTFSLKSNKHAIPDAKGFSSTNLKYMHRFYELYPLAFRPQVVDESSLQDIGENHPQLWMKQSAYSEFHGDTTESSWTSVVETKKMRCSTFGRP